MKKTVYFKKCISFLIIGLSLVACASVPKEKPEDTLRQRVEAYLTASVEGDWDRAYQFFESSYRKAFSKEQFIHKPRKVRTKGYSLNSIEMAPNGDSAKVNLSLDISFQGYTFENAPKTQTWIREKGNWYIQASTSSPSPPFPKNQ